MLDSIRARLRRATDRRRQASHTEQITGAPNEEFQGLIQPTHELNHTKRPAPELDHTKPQAPELILTRPQTVDLGSLRRGGSDEPQFPAPQLAEADATRPKTGQGGVRSKTERRRNGGDADVLILDGRKGGPAERSALEWEAAAEGSPLQISTIPLREALASPRNRPATTKPAEKVVKLSKSGKDTCQSPSSSARQLTDGFASERRAKTSHGSRRKSSETDDVAGSVRKRVQSAHHLNRRGEESGHREGQENRGLNEEAPSPYKARAENRPSSSQSTAEKASRKRMGTIRRPSVLAPTLGTPNGLDSSQEKFVVRGRGGLEERKAVRSAKGGAAKEAEKGVGTKRVVKGGPSPAQNGSQETEWREKTPRLAKNLLASAPPPDPPLRSRRKSDGDETPKRKPSSLVAKRRSSTDVALSPSTSGRGEVLEPREPPRSAKPTDDRQSKSAADFSSAAPADVSTILPSGSKGDAPEGVGGGISFVVGSARKGKSGKDCGPVCGLSDPFASSSATEGKVSGAPESKFVAQKSEQKAVLTGRGANRPSTPSPFAIISKKEDDAARSSGVARNLFRSPSESGKLEADDSGSAEMLEWIQGGGQKPSPERVHKWGGANVAESASKSNESKASVFLARDGPGKEAELGVGSLEALMSELRTGEASAKPAGGRDDVMLTQNALILGQGAQRRLMQECAALMEWLGLTWDVLLKDILEPPPSPLTKTRATRSPGAMTRLSPKGSPKGPPRSPRSSPRLDKRGSPSNRLSTLWIPT